MKVREKAAHRSSFGSVTRGLVLLAVSLSAISPANAQTRAVAERGSSASAPVIEEAEPAPAPAAAQTPAPDGFTVGGFVFKPGGRVKLDIIRDFKPITSEDSFDPRTIPTDGSEGVNSNIHAKETRLFLDIRGPVEGSELRMYVETDFYGSSSTLRLRHAYGSYKGLLAGQTWSTFVDDANMPNTIDFESPMAFPSVRQAQLRFTKKLGDTASWSAAVEDNKSTITLPSTPGKAEYPMPDLVARVRSDGPRLHTFVSGFLGWARFRPTTGDVDDQTLWGIDLSGKLKTVGKDTVYSQYTFGEGIGRYRGGVTAVPDFNGELHAPMTHAIMAGYEHYWVPVVSTNIVYGLSTAPAEDFYAGTANQRLDYFAVNLLYWFLPDRAWAGVEYLHGRREVFSGAAGDADRIQFAVRFNLP